MRFRMADQGRPKMVEESGSYTATLRRFFLDGSGRIAPVKNRRADGSHEEGVWVEEQCGDTAVGGNEAGEEIMELANGLG